MGKTVLDARVVDIEKRRYPSKHYVSSAYDGFTACDSNEML